MIFDRNFVSELNLKKNGMKKGLFIEKSICMYNCIISILNLWNLSQNKAFECQVTPVPNLKTDFDRKFQCRCFVFHRFNIE